MTTQHDRLVDYALCFLNANWDEGTDEDLEDVCTQGQFIEEIPKINRLIAAAPELLKIAEELAAWELDPDRYAGDLADLAHEARAAIAKATTNS